MTVRENQLPRPAADYPFQPVPFTAVRVRDAFWSARMETNRAVSIPHAFHQAQKAFNAELSDDPCGVGTGEPIKRFNEEASVLDEERRLNLRLKLSGRIRCNLRRIIAPYLWIRELRVADIYAEAL